MIKYYDIKITDAKGGEIDLGRVRVDVKTDGPFSIDALRKAWPDDWRYENTNGQCQYYCNGYGDLARVIFLHAENSPAIDSVDSQQEFEADQINRL